MCGFAGLVNYKKIDKNIFYKALSHRGPDSNGSYLYKNVQLFHSRLAIQDSKKGKQPFVSDRYALVFNGEIYNHLLLRRTLKQTKFQSNSDTETLFYLLIEKGIKALSLIDGMFALAFLDKNQKKITLARDHLGKKPLYYKLDQKKFMFGSELNLFSLVERQEINQDSIEAYLSCGFIFDSYTPFQKVYELRQGEYVSIDLESLSLKKKIFFNLEDLYFKDKLASPLDHNIGTLSNLLQESVKRRIESSDHEVGIFLSGGIDSSLITHYAKNVNKNIKTYTVSFNREKKYDESRLAEQTSSIYGTRHTNLEAEFNLKDDLEHILSFYGEPFMDSSAIPSFYIAKEARKHIKVALNGDGADELFGGYRRNALERYSFFRKLFFTSGLINIAPYPKNKFGIYNYIYRLLDVSSKQGIERELSLRNDIQIFPINKNNEILELLDNFVHELEQKGQNDLNKSLIFDHKTLQFQDFLKKLDISSMSNSLEVRSPFLSNDILDFAISLPDSMKIKNFKTKYLLRKLASTIGLNHLSDKPKRGFEVPLTTWLKSDLKDLVYDSLGENCYSSNFIDRKVIRDLKSQLNGSLDLKSSKIIWALLCLEIWHKNHSYTDK